MKGLLMALASSCLFAAPVAARADIDPCPSRSELSAQDDEQARQLFDDGQRAYAAGDYVSAVRSFERALEHSGLPELMFNLANTHERLGEPHVAADLLERYLRCAEPADADLIDQRIQRLRRQVPRVAPAPLCPREGNEEQPQTYLVTTRIEDLPPPESGPSPAPWLWTGGSVVALSVLALVLTPNADPCDADVRSPTCANPASVRWREVTRDLAVVGIAGGSIGLAVGGLLAIRPTAEQSSQWTVAPMALADGAGLTVRGAL